MTFDFTTQLKRKHTGSLKWQRYQEQDIIPMWVADMDLASPPAVQQALHQAVQLGVFGYGEVSSGLQQAFIDWCARNYAWQVEKDWLVWIPGVVPGFNLAVEAWLEPHEGLLVQAPVYPPIRMLGQQRQRQLKEISIHEPLNSSHLAKFVQPNTKALVLCNPHNPLGKVYNRAELTALAELATAHNLIVIADEIWSDLILDPTAQHLPFASLSPTAAQNSITLMAPSKTFNIAGLSCAVAVIPNPKLRASYRQTLRGLMPDMNYLGLIAAQAAWQQGQDWLVALRQHLNANLDVLEAWLQNFPAIGYQRPQATFVAWLDVSQLGLVNPSADFLAGGVAVTPGDIYGDSNYIRLNFGCPTLQLQQALERLGQVIKGHKK